MKKIILVVYAICLFCLSVLGQQQPNWIPVGKSPDNLPFGAYTGPYNFEYGNGAYIFGLNAYAFRATNFSTATGSGTNFIYDGNGPRNIEQNLTNDCCVIGITNTVLHDGISITARDVGATNHTYWFPALWHWQGNTNIISQTAGTNVGIVITNGLRFSAVIKQTDNGEATNTIIFVGESGN